MLEAFVGLPLIFLDKKRVLSFKRYLIINVVVIKLMTIETGVGQVERERLCVPLPRYSPIYLNIITADITGAVHDALDADCGFVCTVENEVASVREHANAVP